ncbi:MAG: hypothetical protein ACE5IL_12960 [Myxococcota bacterium]
MSPDLVLHRVVLRPSAPRVPRRDLDTAAWARLTLAWLLFAGLAWLVA